LKGDASYCRCHLILRDFDRDALSALGDQIKELADSVLKDEPRLKVEVEIKPSSPNMYEYLKDRPEIAERLQKAVRRAGIEPNLKPVRGGTDGSKLTEMGLPCPNIFAGGVNFHGQTEWISTLSMGLSLCTVLNLRPFTRADHGRICFRRRCSGWRCGATRDRASEGPSDREPTGHNRTIVGFLSPCPIPSLV
jgi:hypothetical protein